MYDQFYGLQGRPFQLTPDPHFYFESATHRKALSYLGYGLAQGEGFIVITGDIGAGKTTLVGHLMSTIDPVRLTAVKIVSTQVGGDDMLRLAAQAFGIPADGASKAELLHRVEGFLYAQARTGRRTLLIVDEAQNLAVTALEELRMLSNFQLGGQALLQIFLLGQPEFRDLLASPHLEQLRQRVIATHHLEPMLADEIEPYIVHRLSLVGWNGSPSFTPAAFDAIYDATGGVPRRVNALASRVLLMGAIDQMAVIDAPVIEAVVSDIGVDADARPEAAPLTALDHAPEVVAPQPAAPQPVASEPVYQAPEPEPQPVAPEPEVPAEPFATLSPVETEILFEQFSTLHQEIEALRAEKDAAPVFDHGQFDTRLALLDERLEGIEARAREQDAALRRVLTLMVEWVEREERGQHSAAA
jgi:general secretion pathway protein A